MRITKTRALVGGVVAAVAVTSALALPSLAQDDPTEPETDSTAQSEEPVVEYEPSELSPECEALFDELEAEFEEWTPTEAEIEAINAETDALVEFLAENGVTVEVETDEDGIRYPVFELDEADEARIDELLDQFFDGYFDDVDHADEIFVDELPDGIDPELFEQCEAELEAEFDAFIGELEGCEELLGDLGDHFDEELDEAPTS